MNDLTDQQLLRDYAERQSETAFAELVRRHVDLVYSAALRMVCDPHLAQDVTQAVFLALAQNARHLIDRPVLSGWLHRTAQNIASKSVRTEVRRRAREQEAVAMNELLTHESDADWKNIAPHLDTALGELSEPDRDALLLRYFERKSAREMAQTLGTSEEAAQKRVNRAVERLREFFSRRNVTVGASGLVVLISTNAVQATPIGLVVTISTATFAGTTLATASTATATQAITMTALQKTVVAATIAILAGVSIYEARQASQMRDQVKTLQQQQSPLSERIQQLQSERDRRTIQLAALHDENQRLTQNTQELLKLRGEVARLKSAVSVNTSTNQSSEDLKEEIKFWLSRVEKLKASLQDLPDKCIPEFQFMNEPGWMFASQGVNFDSDIGLDNAVKIAQGLAKRGFADALHNALKKFMAENGQLFPPNFSALQSYLPQLKDTSIFQRYQIARTQLRTEINYATKTAREIYHEADANSPGEWIIREKNPLYDGDHQIVITSTGVTLQPFAEK